jgi:hypothetical protein
MQSISSPFPEWSYDVGVVHCQLRLDHNGVTGWTTLTTNSTTSADAGKVFTVDQYGRQVWASGGGGGGSQVNADWDATSGVAEILNKPTPKTLTAGANISISEGQNTLTISAAAGLPASTSADEGKCLVVDSNGDPEWGTGGSTYTGVDGVVVDNVNDTIGLEAPVDIVAGPGIVIDNPDGNTLRVSLSSNEEVVLWADAAGAFTATLNESLFNFEKIKVFQLTETTYLIQEFYTSDLTGNTFTIGATYQAASNQIYCFSSKWSITNNGVNIESTGKGYGLVGTTNGFTFYPSNVYNGKICRIIGVHRISGGN